MKIEKRQFRIGDLAKQLKVEKFVIRFWEKEFDVSTTRSIGGQRFYSEDDLNTFKHIKTLLYEEGFTIAGAKKQLTQNLTTKIMACPTTTMQQEAHETPTSSTHHQEIIEELRALKAHLVKLQELL